MNLKKFRGVVIVLVLCVLSIVLLDGLTFAENIDPDNDGSQYSYGENVGWLNAEPSGDGGPGVIVSDSLQTGYIWGENIGWVSLSCLNNTGICRTLSYGVLNDGAGNLSGYAWGENVGWINFAPTGGGVTVDPATGKFSGTAWGENIGWITFSSPGPVSFGVTTAWRPPSDTTPPVLTMPAGISAEATSPAGASVNYPLPAATDNTDPAPSVSCSPVSGSIFPLGAATVTCTATDASGNSSSGSFTVTVADTTAPSITCPANIVAEATSASGAMVSYPGATASDAVTVSPVIVYSVATGSTFTLGTTTVTATATDGAGNSAVCSFTVTVQDTTPPVVTPPSNITVPATEAGGARGSAWPALAAFLAGGSAGDAVDPAPTRLIPQVAGVDADNTTLFPVGTTTVTFRFRDVSGNTGTATADVTVIIGQPRLSGKIAAKGRDNSGALYVDLNLTNSGTGNARNIMLNQVLLRTLSGTGTVTYNTTLSPLLPYPAGNLDVGATTVIRLYFNVPSTVTKFSITENGTVRNVVGTSYNYSIGQAVIP